MTYRSDVTRGRNVVARWCALAERRLEYLTELFETGRWRRFHSEVAFLENIREAKSAVETWRNLLMREASVDNSAVEMFRGVRPSMATRPRSHTIHDQPRGFAGADRATISKADCGEVRKAGRVSSDQAPSVPAMDVPASAALPNCWRTTRSRDVIRCVTHCNFIRCLAGAETVRIYLLTALVPITT